MQLEGKKEPVTSSSAAVATKKPLQVNKHRRQLRDDEDFYLAAGAGNSSSSLSSQSNEEPAVEVGKKKGGKAVPIRRFTTNNLPSSSSLISSPQCSSPVSSSTSSLVLPIDTSAFLSFKTSTAGSSSNKTNRSSANQPPRGRKEYGLTPGEYIWANFRFIAFSEDGVLDESSFFQGVYLKWDAIRAVVVPVCPRDSPPRCPICLEDGITAPRMTPCGHCFCWPCLLATSVLGSTADDISKVNSSGNGAVSKKLIVRCPICLELVNVKKDLRPVTYEARPSMNPAPGLSVSFVLTRTPRSTPFTPANISKSFFLTSSNEPGNHCSPSSAHHITFPEKKPFCPKVMYWTRESFVQDMILPDAELIGRFEPELVQDLARQHLADTINFFEAKRKTCPDSSHPINVFTSQPYANEAKMMYYFFHQAQDGSPVFLDLPCIKMLREAFGGDYSRFPPYLQAAPILATQEDIVNPSFAAKYRHLAHLPRGLRVTFCLVDVCALVDGMVPDETIQSLRIQFAAEFADRLAQLTTTSASACNDDGMKSNLTDKQANAYFVSPADYQCSLHDYCEMYDVKDRNHFPSISPSMHSSDEECNIEISMPMEPSVQSSLQWAQPSSMEIKVDGGPTRFSLTGGGGGHMRRQAFSASSSKRRS